MKDKNIYIYTTIIVLIALIIGCLFCFIICRKNTSIKNENIAGKQNSAQKDDSMFNILYTDANGNISTGQLQSNKLVQSNSVGQLQSYTEAGMISYFAMQTPPTGWLVCDGQSYSNALYPDLYSAIELTYGGSKQTGTFNVPDLRGNFIRCLNSSTEGTDPNRTLSNTPQTSTYVFQYSYGHGNNRGDGGAVSDWPETNTMSALNIEPGVGSAIIRNGGNYGWNGVQASTGFYKSIRPQNIAMLACIKT
jgi:hypothetical protein